MGCSGSKKEPPLDPSDVQLSGGDPLSQLSGGDPLSGDWSRSEQRRSSAADLDPSDAFRALDVSRGEADGADEPDGNSFKRRSKAGSARKSSFSKKKAPKLEKKKISFSDEAVDMETSEVAPLPTTALRLRVTQAKVSANTFGVVDMPPDLGRRTDGGAALGASADARRSFDDRLRGPKTKTIGGISTSADSAPGRSFARSNSFDGLGGGVAQGKNVLVEWVEVKVPGQRRKQPAPKAAKEGKVGKAAFIAATPGALSAEKREGARQRLHLMLKEHFLFDSFTLAQRDEVVRAMRYKFVRAGMTIAGEGEPATKFFACLAGGIDLTRRAAAAAGAGAGVSSEKPLLVAQVGPGGTWGSSALGKGGTCAVSATAAVDSEVYVLSRDVFRALKRAAPAAAADGASRSETALRKLPALAQLPPAALGAICAAMREVSAPKGAKLPPDEYGDNWLLLVTAGRLELAAADDDLVVAALAASELLGAPPHPRVGRHCLPFPPPKPVGVGEGEVLASGRRGEEGLLAALWSMAAPAADDDALKLLLGRARAWDVRVAADGGASGLVLPMRAVAAALRAVPALVAQPLGARGALQCCPRLELAAAKDLDALSFATKSTALAQAEPLLAEGGAAPGLTLLLSGRVALTAGRSGGGGGAPRPCGEAGSLDLLGYRSTFGAEGAAEPLAATAKVDCLALSLDRSAARALVPPAVQRELADLPAAAGGGGGASVRASELRVVRMLGTGAVGDVCEATHKESGERYAVKRVKRTVLDSDDARAQLVNERAALAELAHPFVCRLVGTMRLVASLCLVLELCDGPDLYACLQEVRRFDETAALHYAGCVAAALEAIHARGWAYRDLKAENVVLAPSGYAKLVDFGLAKRVGANERLFTVCGSEEYMAPEVVQQTGHDCACDWWGVGVLLYELVCGVTPWLIDADGKPAPLAPTAISRAIVDTKRPLAYPPAVDASAHLRAAVRAFLRHAPPRRLGCDNAGARGVRAHPFFSRLDWGALTAQTLPAPPVPVVGAAAERSVERSSPRSRSPSSAANSSSPGSRSETPPAPAEEAAEPSDTPLDPLSAQLMAFAKQRQEETAAAAPPPDPEPEPEAGLDPLSAQLLAFARQRQEAEAAAAPPPPPEPEPEPEAEAEPSASLDPLSARLLEFAKQRAAEAAAAHGGDGAPGAPPPPAAAAETTEATAPTPEGSFTKSLHDGSVTLASLSEELLAGFLGEEAPAADDGAWDADW